MLPKTVSSKEASTCLTFLKLEMTSEPLGTGEKEKARGHTTKQLAYQTWFLMSQAYIVVQFTVSKSH